jgi:beta-galactosidase
VIGWHIDNEVGSYSGIDCSEPALRAFHAHAAQKYGTVENLNRRWNLIFWNQEIERFDQLPAPTEMMTTRNPPYLLDYNRFCAEGMADYVLLQAEAIGRHRRADQWVVASCNEGLNYTLFREHRRRGGGLLDYVEVNNYPELVPAPLDNAMALDRQRAMDRPRPFLVLEQQVGSGFSTTNGLDDRVRRLWAWEALARGSRSLCWFHWRRFRAGCEWRHPCIVERDRRERSVLASVQAIIREVKTVEPVLLKAAVEADIQVLLDPISAMARDRASEPLFWMEIQRPDGMANRFPMWRKEVGRAIYRPLSSFGLTIDFVQTHEAWDPCKPLIIPDLDLLQPGLPEKLAAFVEGGGTVISFPGVGERDEYGAQMDRPSPGWLGPLFGVRLADYYPLATGKGPIYDPALGRMMADGTPELDTRADVAMQGITIRMDVRHGEILDLEDAEALGTYGTGSCRGRPAITLRKAGRGRAIYLGAVPADAEQAVALYRLLLPDLATHQNPFTRVKLRSSGTRYDVLLNDNPFSCKLDGMVKDLISAQHVAALEPYGVALVAVECIQK